MLNGRDRAMPEPTYMSKAQTGEHRISPSTSADARAQAASTARKDHLPATYPVQYLSDLRTPSLKRPAGSRPPPPSKYDRSRRAELDGTATDELGDKRPILSGSNSMPVMPTQELSHRKTEPSLAAMSQMKKSPFVGRPLARAPQATGSVVREPASSVKRTPSMTYMESGTRWMEKQEAKSLRQALEDMDLEEARRVHSAAQDEAAELVWKHQNPHAPFANPDSVKPNPDAVRDYRSHLRKGSYQRSISHSSSTTGSQRSASDGSVHSVPGDSANTAVPDVAPSKSSPSDDMTSVVKRRSASGKSYDGLAQAVASDIAIAHRRVSSGSKRILSGEKKPFMNPNDRIWEDPQEEAKLAKKQQIVEEVPEPVAPRSPAYVRKNPFARVRAQHDRVERSNSAPLLPTAPLLKHDRVEIQRNPPSQSRNPWYMSNEELPPNPPDMIIDEADAVSPKVTPTKDGKEIRTVDIRAATSKSRKDYSPNLPRPTMVSDKPGRPIVSFQKDWRPREIVLEESASASSSIAPKLPLPPSSVIVAPELNSSMPAQTQVQPTNVQNNAKPPIPQLNFPDQSNPPIILLPDDVRPAISKSRSAPLVPAIHAGPPSISVNEPESSAPNNERSWLATRPLPHHAATAPVPDLKSSLHYTPSIRQSGVLCAHCALPIAGRILSAAGQRFHPGCFVCHQCHTNLECVAFYPEPDRQRHARIERVRARQAGADVPMPEGSTPADLARLEAEDGVDETPRFYCHLDFHELFSPRCKSCKTPIEGEVIVACGAEWHAGHFFCAQCGDPFDSTTPFVEKEGYAWCVGCHTNRYSGKCRKCKKPVTDVVVKALGQEWHEACFVCTECNSGFEDGRYFLRGESQDPVCVRCEERRLKA